MIYLLLFLNMENSMNLKCKDLYKLFLKKDMKLYVATDFSIYFREKEFYEFKTSPLACEVVEVDRENLNSNNHKEVHNFIIKYGIFKKT